MKYKYKLTTICMTFNQAPYIKDALRGFAIQDTTFPVVFVVIDDASTDGEPDVIRNWAAKNLESMNEVSLWQDLPYGQLAVAKLRGKPQSLFVLLLLSENHFRKRPKLPYVEEWWDNSMYHARCEGEDYWTHPQKLQKQVDFLDKHPKYSFCVHNFKRYLEKDACFVEGYRFKENFSFGIKKYLQYWPTHPMTSVVRTTVEPSYETRKLYKHFRDNHLFYLFLLKGQGYYMADVMGVYRITNKGIWTSLIPVGQVEIDLVCYLELYEHNKKDCDLKRKCINQYILYLTLCKNNKVAPKKEIMKEMGVVNRVEASILMMYSKVRRIMKKQSKD